MPRLARLSAVSLALLALAACRDEPRKAAVVTAPKAPALQVEAAPPAAAASTVCLAYQKDRDGAKAKLAEAPTDRDLQDKVTALDALIDDACN